VKKVYLKYSSFQDKVKMRKNGSKKERMKRLHCGSPFHPFNYSIRRI